MASGDQDRARKTDAELVGACLAGEQSAFRELFLRYAGRIYVVAYSHLGHHGDAEDVVQEVFLSAFRSLDKLRDRGAVGRWLCRIAQNCCREYGGKLARGRSVVASAGSEFQDIPAPASAPGGTGVLEALDSLPEKCRLILNLKYMGGLSHAELGDLLGMSTSGVNTQLYRARIMLRRKLGDA